MNIEHDKTHTVALKNGYVCTINDRKTKITLNGKEYGLTFHHNGKVMSFNGGLPGDNRDYDVVQILPIPLPELPKGYTWAGGWPTLKNLKDIKRGDFYLTNYPEYIVSANFTVSPYCGSFDSRRIILEKIGAPSPDLPKEDPEDYVDITDLFPDMHARVGIDESRSEKTSFAWALESEAHKNSPSASMTIGDWYKECQIRHRCKRKHLPVTTSAKNEYPTYYLMSGESKNNAKFVIRTSYSESKCVGHDGKPFTRNTTGKWQSSEDNAVRVGTYKLSSQEEYDKWLASLTVEQFPIYYKIIGHSFGSKFVVKTSPATCYLIKDDGSTSPAMKWSNGDDNSLKDGFYMLSSNQEASQFLNSLLVSDTPKYYLHKERNIGIGWIAYVEVVKDTVSWYSFDGSVSREIRKPDDSFIKKFGHTWNEVTKEEALGLYNSMSQKPTAPKELESIADKVAVEPPKASKVKRAANYFVVEPTINMAHGIIKSLRYILLVSVVGGGVYAYSHPESARKFLPKINIEFGSSKVSRS